MKDVLLQFKVQRDGSWGKINFERATNHVENKARLLTANPWIQHFRSPLIRRERETKSSEQNGSMDMAIMESGHGKYREEFASSDHPIDTCSQIYYQASDGSTAGSHELSFNDIIYNTYSYVWCWNQRKQIHAFVFLNFLRVLVWRKWTIVVVMFLVLKRVWCHRINDLRKKIWVLRMCFI